MNLQWGDGFFTLKVIIKVWYKYYDMYKVKTKQKLFLTVLICSQQYNTLCRAEASILDNDVNRFGFVE